MKAILLIHCVGPSPTASHTGLQGTTAWHSAADEICSNNPGHTGRWGACRPPTSSRRPVFTSAARGDQLPVPRSQSGAAARRRALGQRQSILWVGCPSQVESGGMGVRGHTPAAHKTDARLWRTKGGRLPGARPAHALCTTACPALFGLSIPTYQWQQSPCKHPRISRVSTLYATNGTDGHGVHEMCHKERKMGTMGERI